MTKVIYVKSCIECPYAEAYKYDISYYNCKMSEDRRIGHEDKIKEIPIWCKLSESKEGDRF